MVISREQLMNYVPTHFILFSNEQLCSDGVKNAPLRFVSHTEVKHTSVNLEEAGLNLTALPRPHRVTLSVEVG